MMLDAYEFFRQHPGYKKLVGDDYLFVEYKCPLQTPEMQLWTDYHLVTYVISGKKDWIAPDTSMRLEAGDAIFVRKGVYTSRQYFEEDYCVMLFMLNDRFIRRFLRENPSLAVPRSGKNSFEWIYRLDTNESFRSLIGSLLAYFKQEGEIPRGLVEIKFRELLFNIMLHPQNAPVSSFLQSVLLEPADDLEEVMLQNFRYELGLRDFARLCGKSLSSFKRCFQDRFGQSPAQWLIRKRLEYAGQLLQSTRMGVSEICHESGFRNPSHFSRAFKMHYQLSPLQFRIRKMEEMTADTVH